MDNFNYYYKATLEINGGTNKKEIELWEGLHFELNLEMDNGYNGNPNDYATIEYRVARRGESFESASIYLHNCVDVTGCTIPAMSPGQWDIRATIKYGPSSQYGEVTVNSNVVAIDILFPSVNNILDNLDSEYSSLKSEMESAWTDTKSLANSNGMQEIGFTIYLQTDVYGGITLSKGDYTVGDEYTCGEAATVTVDFVKDRKSYQSSGGKYAVAWFHTHPPRKYCTSGCRPTTASSDDISSVAAEGLPGILMDYDVNSLCPNHDLNLDYKIVSFGSLTRKSNEWHD